MFGMDQWNMGLIRYSDPHCARHNWFFPWLGFSQKLWIWEGVPSEFGSRLTASYCYLKPNSLLVLTPSQLITLWLKIHPQTALICLQLYTYFGTFCYSESSILRQTLQRWISVFGFACSGSCACRTLSFGNMEQYLTSWHLLQDFRSLVFGQE